MSQRFDIGVHYSLRGEHERAIRAFRDVLLDDPQNSRAWSFLGISCAHLGQAIEAESALSKALALAPQNAEAWFHLGVARSLRGEWPEAASAYRHAVALLPEDLVAWHRLGVALAESGEERSASAAFERALVLSRETGEKPLEEPVPPIPEDSHLQEAGEVETGREAESWIDLALSLLSLGEEEEAVAAYERAYTLNPKRASHSLFRPMLHLVTAAAGRPIDEAPGDDRLGPRGPRRPEPIRAPYPVAPETPPRTDVA